MDLSGYEKWDEKKIKEYKKECKQFLKKQNKENKTKKQGVEK